MEILDLLKTEGARLEHAGKRHARELARIIRPQDLEEIRASGGFIPEPAIRMSINRAEEAYAAYVGDDLMCVFGVGVLPQFQAVWMMGSTNIDKHPRVFWRCSKIVLEYLRGKYPVMVNMVHGQNATALRWLKKLGFSINLPEKWGKRGDLFCQVMLVTQRIDLSIPRGVGGLREQELRGLLHV